MPASKRRQLLLQSIVRMRLQFAIQRGLQARLRGCQQLARHMGRECPRSFDGRLCKQRTACQRFEILAGGHQSHVTAQRAGSHGRDLGLRVRSAQEHGKQQGFTLIQAAGQLAKETAGRRTDALQFAAKGGQVQVGLEDLAFVPAFFQRLRGLDLLPLLRHRSLAPACAQFRLELRGDLHGNGRGTARPGKQQCIQRGIRQCKPVHAFMPVEALVLRAHDGRQRRGRNILQSGPCQPPAPLHDAQLVDHGTVAVEQDAFGGRPAVPHVVERRNVCHRRLRDQGQDQTHHHGGHGEHGGKPVPRFHCIDATGFGEITSGSLKSFSVFSLP